MKKENEISEVNYKVDLILRMVFMLFVLKIGDIICNLIK